MLEAPSASSDGIAVQQNGELRGHRYGNFGCYYSFHSAIERIDQISAEDIRSYWINCGSPPCIAVLDIGCNEGDLSVGLVQKIRDSLGETRCFLLGVKMCDDCVHTIDSKIVIQGRP